jgi:hypothetical protein
MSDDDRPEADQEPDQPPEFRWLTDIAAGVVRAKKDRKNTAHKSVVLRKLRVAIWLDDPPAKERRKKFDGAALFNQGRFLPLPRETLFRLLRHWDDPRVPEAVREWYQGKKGEEGPVGLDGGGAPPWKAIAAAMASVPHPWRETIDNLALTQAGFTRLHYLHRLPAPDFWSGAVGAAGPARQEVDQVNRDRRDTRICGRARALKRADRSRKLSSIAREIEADKELTGGIQFERIRQIIRPALTKTGNPNQLPEDTR